MIPIKTMRLRRRILGGISSWFLSATLNGHGDNKNTKKQQKSELLIALFKA
jgi:hypothetical protein